MSDYSRVGPYIKYEEPDKTYIIGIKGTSEIEQIGSNLILSPFLGFPMQENLLHPGIRTPWPAYPICSFLVAREEERLP